VSFAPLLCILFVATRMRALQITQQKGDPPGWAQDCMLASVFATCVQAICCLVMPIFVGSSVKVDEDGNPDYDLRPMIGAYAVTVVKYLALLLLHGSVFIICIAVFAMTPETAHSGNRLFQGGRALAEAIVGVLVALLVALLLSSAKVIGLAVKFAIESCDKVFLGVDITIKHAALGVCRGYVHIRDLVVHQPEEEILYERDAEGRLRATATGRTLTWRHDYVLRAKTVLVKINLWRLVRTLGKEFELENLSFTGIHANIEKPSINMKQPDSNVEYIVNHIESLGLISQAPAEAQAPEAPEAEAGFVPSIILHKIAFGDMGCGVTVQGVPIIGTLSFHPSIGKITFEDVQHSIFEDKESLTPVETVTFIVKALAKRIVEVVMLDIPKQLTRTSGEAAKNMAASSLQGMRSLSRRVGSGLRKIAGCPGRSGPAALPQDTPSFAAGSSLDR